MTDVAKISRVLAGVDFDNASAAAMMRAASLASACGAELIVFLCGDRAVPACFTASQIGQLEAEREQSRAALVHQLRTLSMPADASHSQLNAIAHLLKECVHPVLFVPSSEEIVERNLS